MSHAPLSPAVFFTAQPGAQAAFGGGALAALAASLGADAQAAAPGMNFKQCVAEAVLASGKPGFQFTAQGAEAGSSDSATESFPIFHGAKTQPLQNARRQAVASGPGLSLLQAMAAEATAQDSVQEVVADVAAPQPAPGVVPAAVLQMAAPAPAARAAARAETAPLAPPTARVIPTPPPSIMSTPSTASTPSTPVQTNTARVWQLQELGVQLGNALKGVLGGRETSDDAGKSALTQLGELADSAQSVARRGAESAATPFQGGAFSKHGASEFGARAKDAAVAEAAKSFAAPAEPAASTPSTQSTQPASQVPVWTARPVRADGHFVRQPRMLEQVRQIADFVARQSEGVVKMGVGHVEAQLKLYPPMLGEVRVNLSMNGDGTAAAHFVTARPEAAALLNNHMQEFRESIARHGVTLDQVQVTVAARPASTPGAAQNSAWQNSSWQGAATQNGAADDARGDAQNDAGRPRQDSGRQERNRRDTREHAQQGF